MLIADDHRETADILAELLNGYGLEVVVAYDGMTALDLALRHRPSVAVLDFDMPHYNGLQVAQAIRGAVWGMRSLLVAMTASRQDGSWDAVFDKCLSKPLDLNELVGLLATQRPGVEPTASTAELENDEAGVRSRS